MENKFKMDELIHNEILLDYEKMKTRKENPNFVDCLFSLCIGGRK